MSETKKSAAEASILDAVETAAQTVAKIATDAIDAARDAAEAKKAAATAAQPYRVYLREDQIPKQYYNLRSAMPNKPEPVRLPDGTIAEFQHLAPVFADELVRQELDNDTEYIDIPEGVQEMYKVYRPSPLCRAYNLEKALGTPAKIYYKFEGNNTSGSHKLNSALAQAYYAHVQGLSTITTETGAGQWGTALSEAAAHYGLECDVFMVRASYEQKPFRRSVMQTFGAHVTPSPSEETEIGRKMYANPANRSGSLGTAISEAVERALHVPENKGRYQLGSVLNQVVLHQSIIGLESYEALKQLGEYPDVVIGCAGGGSNLGGLIAPFMRDKLTGVHPDIRFIAVEPASCPSLTRGKYAYDFCDTGRICPLAKMYTIGADYIPSPSHAGGLRFHGMSSLVSELYDQKVIEATSVKQTDVFAAAQRFARTEGILPAPESSHAICEAINEALRCKEENREETILFGLTGTGYFDMTAYQAFNDGTMSDFIPSDEDIAASLAKLPKVG